MINLNNFSGLDPLKRLFWVDLNYDRVNETLRRKGWGAPAHDALLEDPLLFAAGGSDQTFHIIYARLNNDNLLLTDEREVINELVPNHPWALFVFSNNSQDRWHFVNVKVGDKKDASSGDTQRRRLFRRISVLPPYTSLRTATERIQMLDLTTVTGRDLFGLSPLAIQQRHDEAFDVEAVTRAFFSQYKQVFEQTEKAINGIDGDARRLFTQKLFNRLMFIVFLEHKGWLQFDARTDYLRALWEAHRTERQNDATQNFYEHRLKYLFFLGLNTPDENNIIDAGGKQGFLQTLIGNVPYLNGGLFEKDADDDNLSIHVPDTVLRAAVDDLFYRFNFTVVESTPLDVEVAVDPEMLGKMFEELVTGRHESGSYYTPKPVVSFMGREALKGYLETTCPQEQPLVIAAFVDDHAPEALADPEAILKALQIVRVCDPACGSGAYLLGMLHELLDLRAALFRSKGLGSGRVYDRKLEIIQKNIFGVDLDPFAVSIARLRLWLSLIVDYEGEKPPPLPNLDYKIEVGDSVSAPDPSGSMNIDLFRRQQIMEFQEEKSKFLKSHGNQKRDLKANIDAIRESIIEYARADRNYSDGFDWAVEFAEVFADGGFDIVLANPPYVRHELISDLKPILKTVYGNLFSGTADLYVYFYLRGIQLLKPKGMLVFISSSKWLRAAYGEKLRTILKENTTLKAAIDFGDLPLFGAIAYPCIIAVQNISPIEKHEFRALNVNDLSIIETLGYEVEQHGWMQPQVSLDKVSWSLTRNNLLTLQSKIKQSGEPLGEYVKGKIYYGIKTGFNEAFEIDGATRAQLIAQDPRSAEVIKLWLRGRDIKRWRIEENDLYIIYAPWNFQPSNYPAVKAHLEFFREILTKRPEVKLGRHPWYAMSRYGSEYVDDFAKPKITWGNLAIKPQFALDSGGAFINAPANFISANEKDLRYLLGILNSQVTEYTLKSMGAARQGGYIEYKPMYVSQIRIPNPPQSVRTQIENISSELLQINGQGGQSAMLEAELNQLVYQAYNLTSPDIALIERGND